MAEGNEGLSDAVETRAGPVRPVEVFVWPPKPAVLDLARRAEEAEPPSASDTVERSDPVRSPWRTWLTDAEESWLGVTAMTWRDAAARAGWAPDQAGDYCPRCGTSTGPFEADGDGCPACRTRRLAWSRAVRLGSYEGLLREAILAGKYTAWRRVCQELGADLGAAVSRDLRRSGLDPADAVICPVPTSTRRRLGRGVDHTVVMAREVARGTGGTLVRALRRRHRPPQTGLTGSARRRNVSGVFVPRSGVCLGLSGRLVVLVDDVRTTGATMSAAARALQGAVRAGGGPGAVVWSAVAGVTPRAGS